MKKFGKTFLFLLFTFGISYFLAGLFYALGGHYSTTHRVLPAIVYMFIQALSVMLVEKVIHHEKFRNRMLISFKISKLFFLTWILLPVLAFLIFGISLVLPGILLLFLFTTDILAIKKPCLSWSVIGCRL